MTNLHEQIKSGIYNKGDIKFEDIITSIKIHPKIAEAGSILTFTGIVRNSSTDGKPVKGLEIDAYNTLTNETISIICEDLKKINGIIDVKIVHLKGSFDISDDLVYVVILSAHRNEGFDALRIAVETYKKKLTIWKKELFLDGNTQWVH